MHHVPVNQKEVDLHSEHAPESDQHLDHDPHLVQYTPEQLQSIRLQGILVIAGGITFHLMLGCFYCWGTISKWPTFHIFLKIFIIGPYITAYLKSFDPSVKLTDMAMVFPFLGLTTNGSAAFGVKLADKVGHKSLVIVCGLIIALCFLVCSFITNFGGFVAVYCILFGVPSGLCYMIPIRNRKISNIF